MKFGVQFLAAGGDACAVLLEVAGCHSVEADGPVFILLASLGYVGLVPALHVIAYFERVPTEWSDACLGVVALDWSSSFDGRSHGGREEGCSHEGNQFMREMHVFRRTGPSI